MKAKQTIADFLKVFLITGLYLSFFAVQLFFNFDLSNTKKTFSAEFGFHHSNVNGKKVLNSYQNSSVSAKANIRLNKRFEPKSIPFFIAPVTEINLFLYMPEKLGHYFEESVLSSIQLSSLLRGPPAIA
jgi:hypothetical protein